MTFIKLKLANCVFFAFKMEESIRGKCNYRTRDFNFDRGQIRGRKGRGGKGNYLHR